MQQVLQLLGLASRARKIATGEMVLAMVRSKRALLVLIASNASDNTKKKLTDKCTFYQVPYVFIEDSAAISSAIGQNNRMAVAILDSGFAASIKDHLKG